MRKSLLILGVSLSVACLTACAQAQEKETLDDKSDIEDFFKTLEENDQEFFSAISEKINISAVPQIDIETTESSRRIRIYTDESGRNFRTYYSRKKG